MRFDLGQGGGVGENPQFNQTTAKEHMKTFAQIRKSSLAAQTCGAGTSSHLNVERDQRQKFNLKSLLFSQY